MDRTDKHLQIQFTACSIWQAKPPLLKEETESEM